jgi:sterol-4alpha-carboxylate 3-dehydrogenase (decarboxylating)
MPRPYSAPAASFADKTAIVTGASGFVGRRLCEMLAEGGAAKVIALDIAPSPPPPGGLEHPSHAVIDFRRCDVTDRGAVLAATGPADCLWHIAALVGPFHPRHAYDNVNYRGTLHVLDACRHHGVPKFVYASSPSTRFDGRDVSGLTEADLPLRPPGQFLEPYAEAKAKGEIATREANDPDGSFLTVAIAPHQVYGPKDPIFLPNLLDAARVGKLRVFGPGKNRISMVYVDNYCHGLILGYHALARPGAAADVAGEFIIVTDGDPVVFWDALDQAAVTLGYASLLAKAHLPRGLLMAVAYLGLCVAWLTGRSFKLTPFVVKMLTIDRWFAIDKARRLLGYAPLVSFEDGWRHTLEWFKANPAFMAERAAKTQQNRVFEATKEA